MSPWDLGELFRRRRKIPNFDRRVETIQDVCASRYVSVSIMSETDDSVHNLLTTDR